MNIGIEKRMKYNMCNNFRRYTYVEDIKIGLNLMEDRRFGT